MKKNFYLLVIAALMCFAWACSDSDEKGEDRLIIVPNEMELKQTAYADEETTGGFSFTAKSAWAAVVYETTETKSGETNNVAWLKLFNHEKEMYVGGAGSFTLTITLVPNYTGKSRSAKIEIICGKDVVTITVEQDARTEGGEVPKIPVPVEEVTILNPYVVMHIGESRMLEVLVMPEDANLKEVRWSSSDTSIVKVNASTGELKAVGIGRASVEAVSVAFPQ